MRPLFVIVALMAVAFSNAQNVKANREGFNLRIAADSKTIYSVDVPQSSYFVKNKVLQLYASEKVIIQAELKGDSIHSMKVVEKNLHPERTIEVDFSQNTKDKSAISMVLTVKNPFNRALTYQAAVMTPKNDQWTSAAVLASPPQTESTETWPYAIFSVMVSDWHLKKR